MLNDFRVGAEEGLHETERSDRPRIMVAPDKEKGACCEQGSGQKKPGPSPVWHGQRLAHFTEPNDEYQYAAEVMIELGVGNTCDGSFPPWLKSHGSMMLVVGTDCLLHRCLILFIMLRP